MMKILFVLILASMKCFALPVMNVNVAPPGFKLTVFPDDRYESVLYVLPRGFKTENIYHWGFKYTAEEKVFDIALRLDYDIKEILRLRKFYSERKEVKHLEELKFFGHSLKLGTILDGFTTKKDCRDFKEAYQNLPFYGAEFHFVCKFTLNAEGHSKLIPYLMKGNAIALSSELKFKALQLKLDGSFKEVENEIGLPVLFKRPKVIVEWGEIGDPRD